MATTSLPVLSGSNIDPITSPTIARVFSVQSATVNGDAEIMLTSVDLYIRGKPNSISNGSGITNPGISVTIVPTSNHIPTYLSPSILPSSVARLEYSEIIPSIDASIPATFKFPSPIPISTDTEYAIIIQPDSNEMYEFWLCTTGEVVIGSGLTSPGTTNVPGYFYQLNSGTWSAITTTDLKFQVRCARYAVNGVPVNANSTVLTLPISNYEYILYPDPNHFVYGGEKVFQVNATSTVSGSVTYGNNIFTSTSNLYSTFSGGSDPEYIVVKDQNIYNVRRVVSITSNTTLVVSEPFTFSNAGSTYYKSVVGDVYYNNYIQSNGGLQKFMVLNNSNANGSVMFSNNATLMCELSGCLITNAQFTNLTVNAVTPDIFINIPAGTSTSEKESFSYTSVDGVNVVLQQTPLNKNISAGSEYYMNNGDNIVLTSRSIEMGLLPNTTSSSYPSKSSVVTIQTNITDFSAPSLSVTDTDVYFYNYDINNDYTGENTNNGNAYSKSITNQFSLGNGVFAEDVVVYMDVYRPVGTDIKVFVKLYNSVSDSDSYDDKDWTLLKVTNGANTWSSSVVTNDYVELSYGLSPSPNSAFTATGYATTQLSNNVVTGIGSTFNTQFNAGDTVKIYQPLFPNNYIISVVTSVTNATSLVITDTISNSAIAQQGMLIDKIAYPYQAFNNGQNENIVRYYTSNNTIVDNFNTFAVKTVFLSNNDFIVPAVKDIRFVAVSS